jgi:hypothetical protein
MKVERTKTQVFTPVSITITFENAAELKALYHRLNSARLCKDYMDEFAGCNSEIGIHLTMNLFKMVKEVCRENNVRTGNFC